MGGFDSRGIRIFHIRYDKKFSFCKPYGKRVDVTRLLAITRLLCTGGGGQGLPLNPKESSKFYGIYRARETNFIQLSCLKVATSKIYWKLRKHAQVLINPFRRNS